MDTVVALDWERMFLGTDQELLFYVEIVVRTLVIYLYTIWLMRFIGKRGNRELSIFESVLVISMGSATGDVMIYPNVPLLYGMLAITIIILITRGLQFAQRHSGAVNEYLVGNPSLLIEDGHIQKEGLDASRLREDDLMALLRNQGIKHTRFVKYAFLEAHGALSVFQFQEGEASNGPDNENYRSTMPDKLERKLGLDYKLDKVQPKS